MPKYDINRFKQVIVALNTPFQPDGSVDLKTAGAVVNYFYSKGIRQIYVCGSMGEGFSLDTQERMMVTEAMLERAVEKMDIIIRVDYLDTRHSGGLTRHAERVGANVISVIPCVCYRMGEESVLQHWTRTTEVTDLPFSIYDIPQFTGFSLSMDLFRRMLENEKVTGIKCLSGLVQDILRLKLVSGKDFLVFNGPDEQFIVGHLMDADVGTGGTYGAMLELYLKMDDLVNRDEREEVQVVQNLVTPLIYRLCSFASIYGAIKGIISLGDRLMGDPRPPLLPVVPDDPQLAALYHDIRQAAKDTKDL